MDDLTQLLRVIPATEIPKRWQVTEARLDEIVQQPSARLPHYGIRETRIRPGDGKTVYFCSGPFRGGFFESGYDCGADNYVLEGYYFNTDGLEAVGPAYDMDMALQERDGQIATLQSEAETVRGIIDLCGALSIVVKMLEGGSTKEGIAIFLKGKGLSYSQIGVLLHADPLGVSGDAIQQCAKRLLGVAAK